MSRQAFKGDRSTAVENSNSIGTQLRTRIRLTNEGTNMDVHICIHAVGCLQTA